MLRAVIYARYSTDLQDPRSVDDQIAFCRAFADRQGWEVVDVFYDRALSAATLAGRPGMLKLLSGLPLGQFDVIVAEAFDRIARSTRDMTGIRDQATFFGVQVWSVTEGQADTIKAAMYGMMGELYRENNANKVRRGLQSRVRQGQSAGGRSFGYRPDPLKKGGLIIVPEEAAVIVRIFEGFDAGKSPRSIAGELNADGIPAPRGVKWNASTINGSAKRNNGILRNPLYNGEMVWNRVHMPKNPDTGRRVSRSNSTEVWDRVSVPEYRIVPQELFERVQRTKREKADVAPGRQQKPKRLLSGLLRCGACGSGMSTSGKDSSGRTRIRCSSDKESGTCPDPKTFYLDLVEDVVVNSLLCNLREPEVVAAYVEEYQAERKRLAAEAISQRSALERKVAVQQREVDRIIDAVAKGHMRSEDIGDRIELAKAERLRLQAELEKVIPVDNVVTLHSAALKRFKDQMLELREALGGDFTSHDVRGASALRSIVRSVTVFQDAKKKGGVRVQVEGHLNALLQSGAHDIFSVGKVVAGERSGQVHHHAGKLSGGGRW